MSLHPPERIVAIAAAAFIVAVVALGPDLLSILAALCAFFALVGIGLTAAGSATPSIGGLRPGTQQLVLGAAGLVLSVLDWLVSGLAPTGLIPLAISLPWAYGALMWHHAPDGGAS